MLQLADLVIALTGSKSRIIFRHLPTDDPIQRRPDLTVARERLEWQPQVSLADGLGETIAYFRKLLAC